MTLSLSLFGPFGYFFPLTLLKRAPPCSIEEDKVLESALAEHWELDNRSATHSRLITLLDAQEGFNPSPQSIS